MKRTLLTLGILLATITLVACSSSGGSLSSTQQAPTATSETLVIPATAPSSLSSTRSTPTATIEMIRIRNGTVESGTQVRIDVEQGAEDIPVNIFREESTGIECQVKQGSSVVVVGYGNRLYLGGERERQPKVKVVGSACTGVLSPDWLVK